MAKKQQVTRTMNPLHFEDLEPHRFEDLVRQLAYDFKDWQVIEATGRAGSDDGIDIRAYEKRIVIQDSSEDDTIEDEQTIEGNQWIIQCKREKSLGPSDIEKIIAGAPFKNNSVYGYVIAAPVNFSKKSYDVFRSELRRNGITEFALWGRAELEDMLLLPKNDHILFTFFGISLLTKRKKRSSEVRLRVNIKNKLYRTLGEDRGGTDLHAPVLIRDIDDTAYLWKDNLPDFSEHPHWEQYTAFGYHPQGLLVHMHKYYAYVDPTSKDFEFVQGVDLLPRQTWHFPERDQEEEDFKDSVEDYWLHLPRKHQADYVVDGIIAWEDICLVDEKGDGVYQCPHIYVERKRHSNLVSFVLPHLESRGKRLDKDRTFKRKAHFPKSFPKLTKPTLRPEKAVTLDPITMKSLTERYERFVTLFDVGTKYKSLKPRDAFPIVNLPKDSDPFYLEVTHLFTTTRKEYLGDDPDPVISGQIEKQIGRPVADNEMLQVLECQRLNKWQVES